MRRILLLIIILILSGSILPADPLNIQGIRNQAQGEAERLFSPVLDLFSAGLNSGIFAPVSGSSASIGIQVNTIILRKEGALSGSSLSVLPLPLAYAGIRLAEFGIDLFARGIAFPAENSTMKLFGLGGGWEPTLLTGLCLQMIIQYHIIKDYPSLEGESFGGSMIMSFSPVPLLTPYAVLGLNNTKLNATDVVLPGESSAFTMNKTSYMFGLGLKMYKTVTAEVGFIPFLTYSLSAGISF